MNKLLCKILSVVLVVCLFVTNHAFQPAFAEIGQDMQFSKLYLRDIKMFYGQTEDEARKACESEGYIFCPTDLNEGGPKTLKSDPNIFNPDTPMGMYMGYKTTENPKFAITDITLLDMKYTHFEKMDYQKFLDEHVEDFRNEAGQMMTLVRELSMKVEAGSSNALMAYDLLNLFYVDESKPHDQLENQLGYYLIHETDITFFEKFIQRGNASILNKIIDLLCTATSDYKEDGSTWVDRARTSEVLTEYLNGTSETKNMYDANCENTAYDLIDEIQEFRKTYLEAKLRLDDYGETLGYPELEGMTEENAQEKLNAAGLDCRFPEFSEALSVYALLDNIDFQKRGNVIVNNADLLYDNAAEEYDTEAAETYDSDVTLAEYIMELAADEELEDHIYEVYPIVYALSPAQRAALSLGGFSAVVEGLFQSEDYLSKRENALNEAQQKLKNAGYQDGRLYIWTGLDTSLYDKKVVQTDATKEAAAAGLDLQTSQNEAASKENSDLNQALMIIDICTLGIGGVVMIIGAIVGSSMWWIGTSILSIVGELFAESVALGLGWAIAGTLLCAMQILNVIAIVVGLAMLIYSILQWTGAFDQPDPIDYETIPDVVFDARLKSKGAYQVRYDTVTSNADKETIKKMIEDDADSIFFRTDYLTAEHAELTCYQGVYDRWLAMYYSKAPEAGKPIEIIPGKEPFVTSSTYQAPEGYQPLKLITGSAAVDVNDVNVNTDEPEPLYVFFPGEDSARTSGKMIEDDGTYITNVKLVHHEKQDDAINLLKRANFEPININLTPYEGYTFIGYQLGSADYALTDIRLANNGAETIMFGDASYGKRGGDGTEYMPDGMALYATKAKSAGSPIKTLSVQYKRLQPGSGMEPVCLFSGGDAVDLGANWSDNILAPDDYDPIEYFLDKGGVVTYRISSKAYAREFIHQDDPSNGVYLYFEPKEQFLAKDEDGNDAQRYIGGFSYFLAGNNEVDDAPYGPNYEHMQKFAAENGFELLEENGAPFRVMSDQAGEMNMAMMWRDVGGYPADTYNFDQLHTLYGVSGNSDNGKKVFGSMVIANSDGGLSSSLGFAKKPSYYVYDRLTKSNPRMTYHTAMYFGVSYTYNPYRAITGVAGLITPYTESQSQIKNTGMSTPAGSFQACNVSIQGSPIMSAGITAGYFNPSSMAFPLYTNYDAKQKSDLDWITKSETEILSRYLMTSGPRKGIPALKEGEIRFSTSQTPGKIDGYLPITDLRTPGDYEHPMNFALDTTNMGSKYLYLYLKKNTGETKTDQDEVKNANGQVTTPAVVKQIDHEYTQKKYVLAVVCGVGRNPETAIRNLYENAAKMWPNLAAQNKDIDSRPLFTQLDEIIPVDLSSEHPWYDLKINDTNIKSLKNGVWVRGNEAAYYRWDGHPFVADKAIDEYEKDQKCAYIGVIRGATKSKAAYGLLKYYTDKDAAPEELTAGSTKCLRAGGPVNSPEGKYFLYYSTNSGTAAYQAPITSLHVSKDIFINGYNTSFTVSESDRKDSALPQYSQLRMRTDEYNYIHLGYDRSALPYYEQLYIGIGDTKEEAFADMIGTTNAYAAIDVNCNYNSFSKQWIAIGYRRTSTKKNAIRDVFLYYGDDPQDQIRIDGGYMYVQEKNEETQKKEWVYKDYSDTKGTGVPYKLVKHNMKTGSEVLSLNEGNGGQGLYLYYTTADFYREKAVESQVTPITNIVFTYGDISPRHASNEDLAAVFERSYYAAKSFAASDYQSPVWECVLGVSDSPTNWKLTGEGASRYSLNKGAVPGLNGNSWEGSDNRVYMYVDRALKNTNYIVRESAKLPANGYYSRESKFGFIKQVS